MLEGRRKMAERTVQKFKNNSRKTLNIEQRTITFFSGGSNFFSFHFSLFTFFRIFVAE